MSDKSEPREWWAVLNRTRNEGTIAAKDRSVQYEQNVEHVHVIEKRAYDELNDKIYHTTRRVSELEYERDQLRAEVEKWKTDYTQLFADTQLEMERQSLEINDLLAQANALAEALKRVDKWFNSISEKQDRLLAKGFKEACENWDEATTNEPLDVAPLKEALKQWNEWRERK